MAAKLVENLTETSIIIAELLQQTNITRQQADRAARIIQRAFRRHIRDKSAEGIIINSSLMSESKRTNI